MPTYEYHCKTCGKSFDVFQSMSSDAFTSCPEDVCENTPKAAGEVIRKIGAGAGVIFNGSGFYLTDYKNRGGSESSSNSASSSGGAALAPSASATSRSSSLSSSSPSSSSSSAE